MRNRKKLFCSSFIGIAISLIAAAPAWASYFVSTGNGAVIYYDDGSRLEYNARGSSLYYYDEVGNLIYEESDVNLTESQFKAAYSSESGSSSSNSKYADAEINDAYWRYSNGVCVAHWEAEYQSNGKYTITLYRDGHKVTSKTSKGGKSQDFTNAISTANKTGSYAFTVKGNWGGHTDSCDSDDLYVSSDVLQLIRQKASSASGTAAGTQGGPGATPATVQGPGVNTGWQNINGTWKYVLSNGTYAVSSWEYINGKWYYFDANGNMAANQWVQTDTWYYVGPDGDMLVNQWIQSKTDTHIWYYVGGDGRMVTNTVINGWPINANGECYF